MPGQRAFQKDGSGSTEWIDNGRPGRDDRLAREQQMWDVRQQFGRIRVYRVSGALSVLEASYKCTNIGVYRVRPPSCQKVCDGE